MSEAIALIDERLADLRKASDIFRNTNWDRSSEIQRNDREIRFLRDLRTIVSSLADSAPAPRLPE
jgi:hypothetical protein